MPDLQSTSKNETLEISLSDLILFVKKYFLILIAISAVCGILGIAYSFTNPKVFTAQTILLPEYSMGNNNSFFNMAMGSQNSGAEKLVPDLYPNILNSVPFGKHLLTVPVVDITDKVYPSLKSYMQRDTSVSFVSRLMSIFSSSTPPAKKKTNPNTPPTLSNVLVLSSEEEAYIRNAMGLIVANVDTRNGIITLECEMTDPVVAAILVEASKNYLVNYVEEYRTSKTTEQVNFLNKRVLEAKKRLQSAEFALQSYRDRNRNAFLNVARIEEQRLQSDYTLAQSIYTDLSLRLEQAKLKVKEEKPVFKVLEPSKVPLHKSGPKRFLSGIIFAVAGGLLSLFYIVFFREKLHLKLL
jgi:uncharacterized protein involved in exopolysaccharide biosynthesis